MSSETRAHDIVGVCREGKMESLAGEGVSTPFSELPLYPISTRKNEQAEHSSLFIVENHWENDRYYHSPSCVDRNIDCLPFRQVREL